MRKEQVILCDSDELYRTRLHGYLRERIRLPLQWTEFSSADFLVRNPGRTQQALLVISEEEWQRASLPPYRAVLVLTEDAPGEASVLREGGDPEVVFDRISRYSMASEIADKVLTLLLKAGSVSAQFTKTSGIRTKIIAYYTPLGRCMQTSMAVATGQILSANHQVLYIGFDAFPVPAFTAESSPGDLSDLLYVAGTNPDALPLQLERIRQRIGSLPFIPPPASVHRMAGATGEELLSLIGLICRAEEPELLLLDLRENVPGLFDLLLLADEVITITGRDRTDAEKMAGYKRWLAQSGREELLQKTTFCRLPSGCALPDRPDALGFSSLGAYIKKQGLLPVTGRSA